MLPRRLLSPLVFGIPLLVVAFAVLMAGHALAAALQDAVAARVLLWVAVSCLMLLAADLLLLVTLLGLQALLQSEREGGSEGEHASGRERTSGRDGV